MTSYATEGENGANGQTRINLWRRSKGLRAYWRAESLVTGAPPFHHRHFARWSLLLVESGAEVSILRYLIVHASEPGGQHT